MHENKNKVKVYCIVVIGLILLSGIAPLSNFLDLAVQPLEKEEAELEPIIEKEITPKASATYWNLTNLNIFIDDADPEHDWETVNDTNSWCNGEGTFDEPYVIENVTIQGNGTDHCIEILNSDDVYFTIRNCTLENEGNDNKACIYFSNVNNSTLYNNSISGGFYGIYMGDHYNHTIHNNTIKYSGYGIYSKDGGNMKIKFNEFQDCYRRRSIYLDSSDYNDIFNNTLSALDRFEPSGMDLSNSCNNTFINNTLINSGISISKCVNCTFQDNIINGSGFSLDQGIYSSKYYRSNTIDTSNKVNGKSIYYFTDEKGLGSSNFTDPGQIILYNCSDSIIEKHDFFNTTNAVSLYIGKNNSISHNNFDECIVFLSDSANNTIYNNTIFGFADYPSHFDGIYLYNYCENNTIANNTLYDCHLSMYYGSQFQTLRNNSVWHDYFLIQPPERDNDIDTTNLVNGNPLYYYQDRQDLKPKDYQDAGQIILSKCNNALIQKINISWAFIHLYLCINITFDSCNFTNCLMYSIFESGSRNTTVKDCQFKYILGFGLGIHHNATAIGNTIINATDEGIYVGGDNACVSNNKIINCSQGITGHSLKDAIIANNEIHDCKEYGMRLSGGSTLIYKNNISKNKEGFRSYNTDDTMYFFDNVVKDNEQYGMYITHSNYLIYNNTIANNGINALDNAGGNDWNNSLIGNFWSNYTDEDKDDDGIGDSGHSIQGTAGAIDHKPIFWDAPNITITSPGNHSPFGPNAPNYEVKIEEGKGYVYYYEFNVTGARSTPNSSLDHSLGETFQGKFDQAMWSELDESGDVLITFYVNDSRGYCGKREVNVSVILESTAIVINTPQAGNWFGNSSPSFEATAFRKSGETLGDIWYTIDGGTENFTLETPSIGSNPGTVDPDAWKERPSGSVTLTFYVNDSTHQVYSDTIVIYKDDVVPQIEIFNPSEEDEFGSTAPNYQVIIVEARLNYSWYTVGSDPYKNFFTENGGINQTAWTALGDGTHALRFYANDTFGNQANKTVRVIKDTSIVIILPTLEIMSPVINQLSGVGAIGFILNVTKGTHAISEVFYGINGSTQLTFLTVQGEDEEQFTGVLNATEWAKLKNGTLTITFYAKDSQGYQTSASVILRRDIINPALTVSSPIKGSTFGLEAPNYTITCADPSGIGATWYVINDGTDEHAIGSNRTGRIDASAWKLLADGTVNLTFYASDKAGNVKSVKISIIKSTGGGDSTLGGFDIMEFLSSPMGIGTMIGVIGIIAVLGLLVIKKKRSKGKDMTEKKPSKKDKLAERETDSSIKKISSVQESNIADEEPKEAKPIEESTPIQQEEIDETPIRKTRPEYQYEPIEEKVELVDQAAPEDEELEQWGKELEDKELEIEEEVIPEVDDAKAKLQEIEIKIIKLNSAIAQVDANFSEGKITQELYISQKTRLFEELGKLEGEKSVLEEKVK